MEKHLRHRPIPKSPESALHSRGYLPHLNGQNITQSVTIRLFDSVPKSKIECWKQELQVTHCMDQSDPKLQELRKRIDKFEDIGVGECWLGQPAIARIVKDSILYFHQTRYTLSAWCIMPNHVHALITPIVPHELSVILHGWKSFTAHSINKLLQREGQVWETESFDRFIRDERHFETVRNYIEYNPVAANLVKEPHEWPFSSAY